MSTEANDFLKNAFLEEINLDTTIAKSEDLPQEGGGINFKDHFFEPKPGNTYLIKFLPNFEGLRHQIVHRKAYKGLPDPTRKGKTFQYVSSGSAKTCKPLQLFFDLNALEKDGNVLAEQKRKKYLGCTNQGCCKVQILVSPEKEEIGIIRMMSFSTYGPNATVANLLNKKIATPTKEQIAQGFEKEDVFNIWESPALLLVCTKATYDGIEGRDYTKSDWAPKKRGAVSILENGDQHEFTLADKELVTKNDPSIMEHFNNLFNKIQDPAYSIHNFFAYKELGNVLNTEATNDYLKIVLAKVDEICPIIEKGTMAEIQNYGKESKEATTDAKANPKANLIGGAKSDDILASSAPTEIQGSVLNEKPVDSPIPGSTSRVDSILNAK